MQNSAIKTARRLLEVLEYFDEVQRPLSLSALSAHFGYPMSSTAALLKSMVVLGYLGYDRDTRTYLPTMRVASLGSWVQGALFGDSGILALMKHLNTVTEEMISLGTQSDLFAQYIHVIPSPQPVQVYIKPGSVRPLGRSGLGWLLLSARSDEEIELLIRRANAAENDRARHIPFAEIIERVREVRRDGYVFSKHTVTQGEGIIGMLLPVRRHSRVLAIGVGGPVDRLERNQEFILRELRCGIDELAQNSTDDDESKNRTKEDH